MHASTRGRRRLRVRLRDWLSLQRPVTYWSLWKALLETVPVVVALVVAAALLLRDPLALASISPAPYVFFAATLGFAIRRLNRRYVLLSLLLVVGYTSALGLLGLFSLLFAGNVVTFAVVVSLTFLSLVIGFAWPSLHRDDGVVASADGPARLREAIEGRGSREGRTEFPSAPEHGDVGWGDVGWGDARWDDVGWGDVPSSPPGGGDQTGAATGVRSGR
ncbi:MAG: hypothetical protein V5A46_08405 [Haloferacaceae archaeon]